MSCYEQFSLSSEIDAFFQKINELPVSLRGYAHTLIKEHVTDPLQAQKLESAISSAGKEKEDKEKKEEKCSLTCAEELESKSDAEEVVEAAESGEDDNHDDNSNVEAEDTPGTERTEQLEDKSDDSVVEMTEFQIEDSKCSKPSEAKESTDKEGERASNVSNPEKVGLSQPKDPPKPGVTKLPVVIRENTKMKVVPSKKITLNMKRKDPTDKSPTYQLVKTLKKSQNGSYYYETAAVPVGRATTVSIVKPQTSMVEESSSNSSPQKDKRKSAHSHLTYGLEPKSSAEDASGSATKPPGVRHIAIAPKLDIDVGQNNQVILRNSSTLPIAFVSDPKIVVQNQSKSKGPGVDTIKGQLSVPVAYLSSDKVIVPGGVGINAQKVKNKVVVKELGPRTSTIAMKSSDPRMDGDSTVVRYRTILPKHLNSSQQLTANGEVLKEIQFLPNSWGQPIAPKPSVTVQVSNKVSNNILVKNKDNLPIRAQTTSKMNSDIANITKRFLSKNNKLTVRALRPENHKKKKFHLGQKEREALAKQLSMYLNKNKDSVVGDSDEEFVVVIDPNDMVITEDCNVVEPTGAPFTAFRKPKACDKCGKTFKSMTKMKLHMATHDPKFKCKKCNEAFYTREEHYLHKMGHKGQEIHSCDFCKVQFNQFIRLKEHIRLNHPTQRLFKCNECDYNTYTQKTLDSHVRYKHVPKKKVAQLICPVCRKVYHQTSELKNHITTHLPERIFKCDVCAKTFSQKTSLRSHQRNVHGERRYPCNVCPMVLKTRDNQIRHMASHSDAKLFPCPKCTYACNSQGNLVKHVRTQHHIPDFSLRKKEHMKPIAKESDPLIDVGVRKGEIITKAYLNKLSKKLGRDITAPLVPKPTETEDSMVVAVSSDSNSQSNIMPSSSECVVVQEEYTEEVMETEAAVQALEESAEPVAEQMLADLIAEAKYAVL